MEGVAEAVFDNDSEWPDELAFRRGDRLRVLDRRPAGGLASGWWLCADVGGRRGIAPANRLHLLPEGPLMSVSSTAGRAEAGLFHDAAQPFRLLADQPLRLARQSESEGRQPVVRSVPIRLEGSPASDSLQPRPSPPPPPQRRYFNHFTPTLSRTETSVPDSGQSQEPLDGSSLLSDSSASTSAPDAYDVLRPKAGPRGAPTSGPGPPAAAAKGTWWRSGGVESLPVDMERLSVGSETEWEGLVEGGRELRLSLPEATARLFARQEELNSAVALLTSVTSRRDWRSRPSLADSIPQLRRAVGDISTALNAFVDFGTGALVNLSLGPRSETGATGRRLAHMLRPLRDSQRLLDSQRGGVAKLGWTAGALARESGGGTDALDQFLAVARSLPEDSRHVTAFLQTHAALVFSSSAGGGTGDGRRGKEGSPGGALAGRVTEEAELDSSLSSDRESLFDDYDFVDLPGDGARGTGQRKAESEEAKTPTRETADGAVAGAGVGAGAEAGGEGPEVLRFYAAQTEQQMGWLSGAIEDFLSAIEENQSPLVYVGKSKVVILAAHKLVYVGDSLAGLAAGAEAGRRARTASDALCGALKDAVAATKAAAAAHPDVPAVRAMVDAFLAVSHKAHALRLHVRTLAAQAQPA